jgi:hypothetical protein
LFLSKAERDYLIANDNKFKPGYDRVIRSRLNKKIQQFVSQELPLLIEKGYVTQFRNVTENRNTGEKKWSSLVRMPPKSVNERNKEEVGRERFGRSTPAMSRRYPNQARPPARYTMKKFGAQIYVIDRLYMKTT